MHLKKKIINLFWILSLLALIVILSQRMMVFPSSVGGVVKSSQEDILAALEDCLPGDPSTPKTILSKGIPILQEQIETKEEKKDFLGNLFCSVFNIDFKDVRTFLSSQIPLLSDSAKQDIWLNQSISLKNEGLPATGENENKPQPFEPEDKLSKEISGQPLVAIYHTHTAESYLPWAGVTHAQGGKRGNIVDVGKMLAKGLEDQKIKVVHSLSIHDYPTFRESYRRSYVTASSLVEKYPSLKLIIDLHRDAGVKEKSTINIQGKSVARILIDIGTDRLGLPHPHWRENLSLGQAVEKKMNQMYPGLCRGIVLSEARYNQHVSPRAILLEIGDERSTKEEALRSAMLCAKVLGEVIKKN